MTEPLSDQETFTLPGGWIYAGCPHCGYVVKIPDDRTMPWCPHNWSNFAWMLPLQAFGWEQMVPVAIREVERVA